MKNHFAICVFSEKITHRRLSQCGPWQRISRKLLAKNLLCGIASLNFSEKYKANPKHTLKGNYFHVQIQPEVAWNLL